MQAFLARALPQLAHAFFLPAPAVPASIVRACEATEQDMTACRRKGRKGSPAFRASRNGMWGMAGLQCLRRGGLRQEVKGVLGPIRSPKDCTRQ